MTTVSEKSLSPEDLDQIRQDLSDESQKKIFGQTLAVAWISIIYVYFKSYTHVKLKKR